MIRCEADEKTIIERLLTRSRRSDRNIHKNEQVMRFLIQRRCENIDQIIGSIKPAMMLSCSTDDKDKAASMIIQSVSPLWTEAMEHVKKSK